MKCHRPGEIASSLLLTGYNTVRPKAELIKEKVAAREMPPWPADPARSLKFRNDPRLSKREIDTIVAWVSAGAPKGNEADLPPMPEFTDGWMHPRRLKPDLVITLPRDVQIPARGVIPYVRVLVKVPFEEDRWIAAIQTGPSNPSVVHHMALTEVALPGGMSPADMSQMEFAARQMGLPGAIVAPRPAVATPSIPEHPDMLAMYTPGSTLEMYPPGSGKLLKGGKNMYLNFNVHYEANGKPEIDRARAAFWFLPGPPEHQLFRVNGAGETIIANGTELLTDAPGTKAEGTSAVIPPIPPLADNYELIGVTGYTEPITIYQFQPHAHHRGKDFTYSVVYPDGREQTLLCVPHYDHMSQMAYELETPLKLPAGSKLVVTAHYDNSTGNVHNPAPEKAVYFRDQNQSWDEMFTPFTQISIDSEDPAQLSSTAHQRHLDQKAEIPRQPELPQLGHLMIAEAVGCLEMNSSGNWSLTGAGQPETSETEATSSVALRAAAAKPLGTLRYRLLGVSVFNPSSHERTKVAVKGILLNDSSDLRINVTSLQEVAARCAQ